jgi:hypothetical protein
MPPKVVLPRVKLVKINGDQDLFDAFDLRDSEISSFYATSLGDNVTIDLSSFPDQIANFSLSYFEWTQKPVQPRHFKDLTYLDLQSTGIYGTLGEYLRLPNLRYLGLTDVQFQKPENTGAQDHGLSMLFSDTQFLQGSPLLETIDLGSQEIDEKLIEGLRTCTVLKNFTLSRCILDRFVSQFLEHLENGELVPSLDRLEIWYSWPTNVDIIFEEFSRRLMTKRPNIWIWNSN